MKDLKLNLLEKKEMDEVRGGDTYRPLQPKCSCVCYDASGQRINHLSSSQNYSNMKSGILPRPDIEPLPFIEKEMKM